MMDYHLPPHELTALRAKHRVMREKRYADRVKAVILLGSGWSAEQVAEALLIDPNTARSHFKRYKQGGLQQLTRIVYCGGAGWLSGQQLISLLPLERGTSLPGKLAG